MSDAHNINEPTPDSDTPWEFLPTDDEARSRPTPAELDAVHIEPPGLLWPERPVFKDDTVVHYLADEEPEIRDRSIGDGDQSEDSTLPVDELLARQHYLEPVEGEPVEVETVEQP